MGVMWVTMCGSLPPRALLSNLDSKCLVHLDAGVHGLGHTSKEAICWMASIRWK